VLMTILLSLYVSGESVEMVDAEVVPHLGAALYDLPPEAFQLTKFEKYIAEKMAVSDPAVRSMLEHTAVVQFHHEGDSEAQEGADIEAEVDAESEGEEAAAAEDEAEAEVEDELEAEAEGEDRVELDAESEAELENELTSDADSADADASEFLELEAMMSEMDHLAYNSTRTPRPLVAPKIVKGTIGLPDVPPPPKLKQAPCPAKKRKHRGGKHRQSRGSLIEMEEASQKKNEAPARKVHIHVKTKLHGGPGSENLLRVEDRFDRLHDKVMGKLNRLMSRITRHPGSIEDKDATYHFTE